MDESNFNLAVIDVAGLGLSEADLEDATTARWAFSATPSHWKLLKMLEYNEREVHKACESVNELFLPQAFLELKLSKRG